MALAVWCIALHEQSGALDSRLQETIGGQRLIFHGLFLPQIVLVTVLRLSECGRRHARSCQPSRAQQETVVTAASVHVAPVQCEWHARCRGVHSLYNAMHVEVVVGGCCLLSARAEESFTSPRRQPQWQPIIGDQPDPQA